jgi:UDP-N-acetylglucosamine 1-carboxyvinyltransferase
VDLYIKALEKMGAEISVEQGYVCAKGPLSGTEISFPKISVGASHNTIMAAVLTKGTTIIHNPALEPEVIDLIKLLQKMGADIEIFQKKVIIRSNNILYGGEVCAEDLRGGAALVIAGLAAEGTTTVSNTKYTKRGYSAFAEKIRKLGGDIIEYEK